MIVFLERFCVATLVFVLAALLLSQDVNARQDQTNPSDKTSASAPAPDQQDSADNSPERHQEDADVENKRVIGNQSSPMIESVRKLAKKTNWTLALSVLALGVSVGSLLVGKASVTVTREIGQKQTRAYLSIANVTFARDSKKGHPEISFKLQNTGNSPAFDIYISDLSFKMEAATPDMVPRSFSGAVSHRVFVKDLMSSEVEKVTIQIFSGGLWNQNPLMKEIQEYITRDAGNVTLLERFCNIEYVDVFGKKSCIPYSFMGDGFDLVASVNLDIRRKLKSSNIRAMAKSNKGNKANEMFVKSGLRKPPKHQPAPDKADL